MAAMSTAMDIRDNGAAAVTGRNVVSGLLLGVGVAAFVDETVFHQLLHWHHFYDKSTPAAGLVSDGIFHAVVTGEVRMIEQRDFETALHDIRPSIGDWFAAARNVAQFANEGVVYDDVVAYLKRHRVR
jgi:hypothetical protein